MNYGRSNYSSKVGLLLLSLLFLIGVVNALPASDNAQTSFTPEQLKSIATKMLNGESVTPAEKEAAYSIYERLAAANQNTIPSIDLVGGPDGAGYTFIDSNEPGGPTFSWVEHTGAAVNLPITAPPWTSQDDGYYGFINLGFTFNFYGVDYTQFSPSCNGYITFSSTYGSIPSGVLPRSGFPAGLYFWARDMHIGYGSTVVRYENFTGPNRVVVTYDSLSVYNTAGASRVSAQVIIYENGNVLYQYRNLIPGTATPFVWAIGVQNVGANTTNNHFLNYPTLPPAANTAILFSPPCYNTLGHLPASGSTGVTATPTLSWTNGSCVASCDVYLSTVQADVTNLAAGALVADHIAGNSYTPASPLLNNTVYYWRVVSRNASNATLSSNVFSLMTIGATPMSGSYTIGGVSPDYATFTDAVNALVSNSINGPVVFNVRPGTYSERITIPVLNGSSATNTVTFQRETAAVLLNGAGTVGTTDATVMISGADYVTFDGIDVADPGTADVEFGYWITNANATDGGSYNTVKNATITLNRTNASTRGIRQYYTTIPTSSSGGNHYNKYLNLKISNTRYGAYIYGYSTTYPDLGTEVGSTVAGTTDANRFVIGSNGVDDIGGGGASYGLYMYYQNNATVHDIDVANVTSVGAVAYGVYAYYQGGTYNFYNNRVYNIHSTSTTTTNYAAYGIYGSHTSGYTYNIYNNFIYSINSTSIRTTNTTTFYMYGAYLTGSGTFNFDNNSVLLNQGLFNQTADLLYNSACLYTVTGTFNTRNNVLYNKTPNQAGTSKHYVYYRSSGTLTSDNNVFYLPNTTNGYAGYFTVDQATLANWQTAALVDAASWATNPGFVDDTGTDLHIAPNQSSTPVEGNGQVLAWISSDIDGEARSMPRDIGADDGTFLSNTAPGNVVLVSPANGALDILSSSSTNWTFGENTTDCDVYFSTNQTLVNSRDPSVRVVEGQNVTSYDPSGDMLEGVWYYWCVVARNAATLETNVGPVWSFRTYIPPLSGILTIGGTTPNFATFTDAINAINVAGIGASGVTFNVRPGTYAERITINPIATASETSPVVFQRETGSVTLSGLGTSATDDAMVWLNGCDYVTFDGIDILDPGTSSTDYVERGYYISSNSSTDGANYNTIRNAHIQMHKANTSSYGVRQYYTTTPTAQSGANSYNRYLNLKVTDTYYGVYLYSSSSSSFYDMNNEVGSTSTSLSDPNRFVIGSGGGEDIGNYGLYLYYGSNYNVHNIDVRGVSTASASGTLYSMYVYYTRGVSTVNGCRVYEMSNAAGGATSTVNFRGMYLYPQTGTTLDVYNNMLYGFTHPRTTESTTLYVTPVYSGNSGNLNFHHNSIAIGSGVGVGPSNTCWYIVGGVVTANNNIFFNNSPAQVTGKHYGIYRSSATSFTSDYNDIFVQNANGFTGYYAGDMVDMTAWRGASLQDANSLAVNPMFVNETTDPHIGIASNSPIESAGTPLVAITSDIEGDARNASTPDIGADEGVFNDPFAPSNPSVSNIGLTSLTLNWQDNTTDELGFPVFISTDGTTFTPYGAGNAGDVSMNVTGLTFGTPYWFRVFALLPGGPTAGYASYATGTLPTVPDAPTLGTATSNSVPLTVNNNTANPNSAAVMYAVRVNGAQYVQANGSLGATMTWRTLAQWGAPVNITGLTSVTLYTFDVIARSAINVNSAYSATASVTTPNWSTNPNVFVPAAGVLPVAITDNGNGDIPIIVTGTSPITDVDIRVSGTHTYTGDVDFELVHANGTTVVGLIYNRGGSGDNWTNMILDDEAGASISTGTSPFTGTWIPETPLSALDGLLPAGTWYLRWRDEAGGDVGFVTSIELAIGGAAPPSAPSAPSPADLATNVGLTPTLGWTSDGTTFDVYLGTDNPPTTSVSMGQATTTYNVVAPLTQGMQYFWYVVAHNASGSTTGSVWSFTTVAAPSVPTLSLTYSGGNAVLTWTASTGTVDGYRVYRYSTGYFNAPATGTLIGTTDGVTLTLTDPGVNGQYYYRVIAFNNASTASMPGNDESTVIRAVPTSAKPSITPLHPRGIAMRGDGSKSNVGK